MTLIVGMHFGDSVGILSDTRVTKTFRDGTSVFEDDFQKVYFLNSLVVGVTGDARAAGVMLHRLYENHISQQSMGQALHRASDKHWLADTLLTEHQAALSVGEINADSRFGLMLGAENSLRLSDPSAPDAPEPAASTRSMSFEDAGQALTQHENKEAQYRLVMLMTFPGGSVRVARPGEVLLAGSGSYLDRILISHPVIQCAPMDGTYVGTKLAAAGIGYSTFHEHHRDDTFNGITIGMGFQNGRCESTYCLFREWPADSLRPNDDRWRRAPEQELRIPNRLRALNTNPPRYYLGMQESMLGSIYDLQEGRRLDMQTIFGVQPTVKSEACGHSPAVRSVPSAAANRPSTRKHVRQRLRH